MLTTIRLGLLLAVVAPLAAAMPGDVVLAGSTPAQINAPGPARHLLLADLDGDGRVDLVRSSNEVQIWRQIDDGRLTPFAHPTSFETPEIGGSAAVADLDGDGRMSIVLVGAKIRGLEFEAPWQLGPAQTLAEDGGNALAFATAADLDGDGHADLLGSGNTSATLRFWHGDGAGGLQPSIIAASLYTEWTELADFDLDGQLDLLAANGSSAVLLLGQGDGHFAAQAPIPLSGPAKDVALGQLDGDGTVDAAIAVTGPSGGLQLLRGDGHGGLAPWLLDQPGHPAILVDLHDVDGDGDDDILSVGFGGVTVRQSTPSGPENAASFPGMPGLPWDAVYAQLGGDVPPSILLTYGESTSGIGLTVWDCDADGRPLVMQPLADAMQPLALADVDGDGREELVAWQKGAGQVVVHEIPGDGTLGPSSAGTPLTGASYYAITRVLDLDGDARQDLLINADPGWLPWRSNGDGTFTPGPPIVLAGSDPEQDALGDLDGDGDLDLLVIRGQQASPVARWYANLHDGSFGPAIPTGVPTDGVRPFALGDVDGDGLADLVAGSLTGIGLVREYKGLGNGTFGAPVVLSSGPHGTEGLRLVDLDGDHDLDIVAVGDTIGPPIIGYYYYGELTVLHGHGDGRFDPAQYYRTGAAFSNLSPWIVDFDGDGRSDILVHEDSTELVNLMVQAADGSFGEPRSLPIPLGMAEPDACAADVDGDGVKDLLFTSNPGAPTTLHVARVHVAEGALDLGHGKLGSAGVPVLTGGGTPQPMQLVTLDLQAGPASTPLLLVLGLQTAYTFVGPQLFLEPQLVPQPQLVIGGLTSDAAGHFALKARWPSDAPPGFAVYAQVWCVDPFTGQPVASNALQFEGD